MTSLAPQAAMTVLTWDTVWAWSPCHEAILWDVSKYEWYTESPKCECGLDAALDAPLSSPDPVDYHSLDERDD